MLQRQTTAPGQYLGYSLQASRVLNYLLDAGPGDVVALEAFGDVAISTSGESRIVEEDKSSISSGNPISDRGVGLWKTLGNWSEAVANASLPPRKTRFVLYTARHVSGSLIRQISSAATPKEARAALNAAKKVFPRNADGIRPRTVAPHVKRFFSTPEPLLLELISHITHEAGAGHSITDLERKLRMKVVPPELIHDIVTFLLGWTKATLDTAIERGLTAAIRYEDFEAELLALVRKLDRDHILTSFAGAPEPDEVAQHLKTKTYVQQLDLIDRDHDEKLRAVADFLRARADRIQWAAQGRIHASSFSALEDDLVAAWQNLRIKAAVMMAGREDREVGSLLFAECSLHKPVLQGIAPPSHFIRGSFHELADALSVGWHPRYRALLAERSGAA